MHGIDWIRRIFSSSLHQGTRKHESVHFTICGPTHCSSCASSSRPQRKWASARKRLRPLPATLVLTVPLAQLHVARQAIAAPQTAEDATK